MRGLRDRLGRRHRRAATGRAADPRPGPGEVLVRVRASSLNYRDLMTVLDPEPGHPYPRIPNSDGAGEVLAVGAGVTASRRATASPVPSSSAGMMVGSPPTRWRALGGALDGVLAEEVVLAERGLVHVPAHLSFEEAATLPCAAVTAWHALIEKGRRGRARRYSCSAPRRVDLRVAVRRAARRQADRALEQRRQAGTRARGLGAWHTLNYRATPSGTAPSSS